MSVWLAQDVLTSIFPKSVVTKSTIKYVILFLFSKGISVTFYIVQLYCTILFKIFLSLLAPQTSYLPAKLWHQDHLAFQRYGYNRGQYVPHP